MSNQVPEGWSYNPLSLLADIDKDSLKTSTDPDYRFRYIDIASVSTGQVKLPSEYIKFSDAPSRARKKLKQGDVLMSTVRPNLKAFAYFNVPEADFVASTGFSVIRAKNGNDGRFIFNAILGDDISSQIDSLVVGSNYPAINSTDVKNLEVLTPTPAEQQKIAKILNSVDDVIEKTQAQIDKLKDLKMGMMQELLTRGVGVDGKPHTEFKDSPVGRIPKAWDVKPIIQVLESVIDYRGKSPPKSDSGIPLLTAKNIRKGFINVEPREFIPLNEFDNWMVRGIPSHGDVFITTEAPLGNVARVPNYKFAIGQRVLALCPKQRLIDTDFLLFAMQSDNFVKQLELQSTGSTVAGIKQSTFKNILLPVPTIEEQKILAKYLVSIINKYEAVESKLIKLKNTKKALMQDLLTGKVRVNID
ncbi:restriction endonuclease subunit S [Shewanella marisflavi]|uniref:restriction endonuclease subunit S n=1 Tax=Shewanella marisflavi TaxID=260364 RepID=UPI003AAF9FAC